MPPDVFLALASSGLTLVASLMFFMSDEEAPPERPLSPKDEVAFCDPPRRQLRAAAPPPLPRLAQEACIVDVSTPTVGGLLTLRPQGDTWLVTLESVPLADSPAVQVHGTDGVGTVHDLRWHGRAGLTRPVRRQWRQKPGQA
jgi:hypothetical protein